MTPNKNTIFPIRITNRKVSAIKNWQSVIFIELFLISVSFAQYRCDWNVFDAGGATLSSTEFQARVSVSQTAIGYLTGTGFNSWIGFCQIDTAIPSITEEMVSQKFPVRTEVFPAHPNPFAQVTRISYSLEKELDVNLVIYNTCGQKMKGFYLANQKPGSYSFSFNATDYDNKPLAKGIYFYKFSAGDYQRIKKLLLIK